MARPGVWTLDQYAEEKIAIMRARREQSSAMEKEPGAAKGNVDAEKEKQNSRGAAAEYGMGFTIGNFRAEMDENAIIPTHSYLVTFAPFSSLSQTGQELNSYIMDTNGPLTLRCDQATLPGPRILTMDNVRRYGYGPVEIHAHAVQFQNLTLTWVVDKRAKIIEFFNKWMKRVVNYESEGGGNMEKRQNFGSVAFDPYEVGYKDDYSLSAMHIHVYDAALDRSILYYVYDVFPVTIHNTDVQWGNENSMVRLSIDFAYTDVKIETPRSGVSAQSRAAAEVDAQVRVTTPIVERRIDTNTAVDKLPPALRDTPRQGLA